MYEEIIEDYTIRNLRMHSTHLEHRLIDRQLREYMHRNVEGIMFQITVPTNEGMEHDRREEVFNHVSNHK